MGMQFDVIKHCFLRVFFTSCDVIYSIYIYELTNSFCNSEMQKLDICKIARATTFVLSFNQDSVIPLASLNRLTNNNVLNVNTH